MYEKFYGLRTSPFRLNPDPTFFFGSKGHKRALAYLRYGVNQKEGFIVITGTPGTGKTTLARALLTEMGSRKTVVSELNTTHLQAEDVLRMVAATYGLPHEDAPKSTLLKRLEEFFISRYRAGYHVLLIVDESQNLPKDSIEELRMLSNFYIGKDALVQIFLLGQEQFREQLYSQEMEQLRQRVVASCHLEPLGEDEAKEYILHRLTVAGWQGDPQFSDRAFARIFSVTSGVPRRINTFCDRLMLYGALENKHSFVDDDIKAVAKELSLEISPKDRELHDIKPADQQDADGEEKKVEDELSKYSDEIKEVVPLKTEQEPMRMSEIAIQQDSLPTDASSTIGDDPSSFKAVSNGEDVDTTSEPLPAKNNFEVISDNDTDLLDLVALAVDFQKSPQDHKGITSSKNPLPEGITDLLKVAIGRKSIPQHLRIDGLEGVTDKEIKEAIRFYIKKVLLSSTADYYRRLGVSKDANHEHIRSHYKYLFRIFQPDKEARQGEWDETYTRRINQAYGALRSEQKREEYDAFLNSLDAKKGKSIDDASLKFSPDTPSKAYSDANQEYPSREPQKKKSPFAMVALSVLVIGLLAGGFLVYQSNITGSGKGLDISNLLNSPSATQDDGSNSVIRNEDQDKVARNNDELPLVELPSEDKAVDNNTESKIAKLEKTVEVDKLPIEQVKTTKPKVDAKETTPVANKPKPEVAKNEATIVKKPKPEAKPVKKVEPKPKPVKVAKPKPAQVNKPAAEKTIAKAAPEQPKPVAQPVRKPVPTPKPIVKTPPPVQVAKFEPVKQSAVSTVFKPDIRVDELNNFISYFTLSYEEGVIDQFIQLFTTDAATNDAKGREFIRKDYESLFESTEMRVIDLQGLIWDIEGDKATGNGAFVVTVLRKGGDTMRKFTGSIKLDVQRKQKDLKISGMYHAYGGENN